MFMRDYRGFSLVELLVVIVVIGLIAAIAIPNLLASRRAANEASATSSLRTLFTANISYAATTGNGNYAGLASTAGISSLTDLLAASYIDSALASGDKSGFSFIGDRIESTQTELATFYFAANPTTPSGLLMTGTKRFGVETTGVIHFDGDPTNLAVPFDEVTVLVASPMNN